MAPTSPHGSLDRPPGHRPWWSLPFRRVLQSRPRQTKGRPFLHGPRAKAAIEADCRLVPIKRGPLEPAAAALHGDPRQLDQQGLAVALAAMGRLDEQVFQVDTGLADE